jgi:hypothetical protein
VSLLDLVVLVDDPADIATMLVRLTGEDTGPGEPQSALVRKYSDVTRLFSALDSRLAQVMFGKQARAVLKLEPERRNNLLQRTILPGLLDGRADGKVLRDFPDMDRAESICLLLDLETAAPEVLSAALNRLDLAADRREALVPLIEQRMRAGGGSADDTTLGGAGVERHARELIKIDGARGTDFSEFAAFDLSIDAQAEAAVADVRSGIGATDVPMAQLLCVSQLVRIERNPTLVDAFLRRAIDLFGTLERAGRWSDVIATVDGYATLGEEMRTRRPDVTDTISKALGDYCTPVRRRHRFRHDQGRFSQCAQIDRYAAQAGCPQLLHRRHSNELVQIAFIDRKNVMRRLDHDAVVLFQRIFDIQRRKPIARRHQLPNFTVTKFKHPFDHLVLARGKNTRGSALLKENLNLFLGNRWVFGMSNAKDPQHRVRRRAKDVDQRRCDVGQHRHRLSDEGGNALRVLQSQPLWHQLSDHQREVRHDCHDEQDRDHPCIRLQRLDAPDQDRHGIGEASASEESCDNADQGNPDLHCGQESIWVLCQMQRNGSPTIALVCPLLQSRFAR